MYTTAPLLKAQGSLGNKRAERELEREVHTQKPSPLDTAGQLHLQTHSGWYKMHKTCVHASQTKSQDGEESWI